jgi:signal transduction histidine kinase
LFNAVKYAETSQIRVRLQERHEQVAVAVEDEGTGFDPSIIEEQSSGNGQVGLRRIRERANLLGGDLELDSEPGAGTRVTVMVPRYQPRET